jgi:hypothetical protein
VTRRRTLLVAVAVVGFVAVAGLVFQRLVYVPQAPPAAPPPRVALPVPDPAPGPDREPSRARVVKVAGIAERGASGRWERVQAGDTVGLDDSIRTRFSGRVDLSLGERSSVVVAEASEITLRELSAAVHRLRLARGRISVDYQADGSRVLRVENDRGDAMAEAGAARFSVIETGTSFAVATETGVVDLRARGVTVKVADGRQAVAPAGQPPTAAAVPGAVLLKIAARSRVEASGRCSPVVGQVERGVEVLVDGERVPVDAGGRFRVPFTAEAERRRRLVLVVRDSGGRSRTREIPCEYDRAEFSVEWKR